MPALAGKEGFRSLRWLPPRDRLTIEDLSLHGRYWVVAILQLCTTCIICLPPVARVTGVSRPSVVFVWVVCAIWSVLVDVVLHRRAATNLLAFHVLTVGSVFLAAFVALSLPVLAGRPDTPLWIAFTMVACIFGGAEYEPPLFYGLFIPLVPLLTIPIFLERRASLVWSVLGPLLSSFGAGVGYWLLAGRRNVWRRDRIRREMEMAAQRLAESERERERLARDLHDSVGTALSLVALYSSLAEHQEHPSLEPRRFASTVHHAARAALADLRGVIQALPQAPTTLEQLGRNLVAVAQRSADAAGARIILDLGPGAEVVLAGSLRTTIVRVFQEAVHNALHHGGAKNIFARLSHGSQVDLVVEDDGTGFDPAETSTPASTGIAGMRERAREHGGQLTVASGPGGGTRVHLGLPVPPIEERLRWGS